MKKKMKPIMAAVLAASMTGSSLSAGVGVIPGGGGMTNVSEVYGAELTDDEAGDERSDLEDEKEDSLEENGSDQPEEVETEEEAESEEAETKEETEPEETETEGRV